jgi:uncharacterized cupredoxin-like copper-binding protein
MKRFLFVALLLVAIVASFAAMACEEEDDGDDGGSNTPTAGETAGGTPPADGTPPDDGAEPQAITVVSSDDFTFDPDALTVTAGQPVVITLDNSGGAIEHDFASDEMPVSDVVEDGTAHEGDTTEVHVAADGGGSATLEFTPTEAGEYVFYCSVEGHRDAGMEGTITVE